MTKNWRDLNLNKLSIQEYLSLGYLYLIVLGVIFNVVYYKFLGINILNYTTILDILITPIVILASEIPLFFSIIGLLALGYWFFMIYSPRYHAKNRTEAWYQKRYDVEALDKEYAKEQYSIGLLYLVMTFIFSIFIGFGLAEGAGMMNNIASKKVEMDHVLTFADKTSKEVKIIGQNSLYLFCVAKAEKEVAIIPIAPHIIEIKKLEKNDGIPNIGKDCL